MAARSLGAWMLEDVTEGWRSKHDQGGVSFMEAQSVSAAKTCPSVLSVCGVQQDGMSKLWAGNCELRNHGQVM